MRSRSPQLLQALKGGEADDAYSTVSTAKRMEYGLLYLGLLAYLAMMTQQVHDMLGR